MPMELRWVRISPTLPCWLKHRLDDVRLANDNTISTDYRGYAIVPYVTPYRRTDITLDSTTLGEDMELPETTKCCSDAWRHRACKL
ncbi:Outer membrane usher protein FimD [Klebsiella pneumoniae]|nr:Outer membrane usher protein FimD [Klebsiella pneumoniae]